MYRATWEAVGEIPVVGFPNPLTSVNAMRDAGSKCEGVWVWQVRVLSRLVSQGLVVNC